MPVVPVLIVGWPNCRNLLLRGLCVLKRVFNECTVMLTGSCRPSREAKGFLSRVSFKRLCNLAGCMIGLQYVPFLGVGDVGTHLYDFWLLRGLPVYVRFEYRPEELGSQGLRVQYLDGLLQLGA